MKSYNNKINLKPAESYSLHPIFFFDETGEYWMEIIINGNYEGFNIEVYDDYEYGE